MCKNLLYLTLFVMVFMAAPVEADTLSGLADVTVVDGAIISFRYEGIEYIVGGEDLALGTTTRWYIDAGVETLWAEGDPTPAATVSGTSTVKAGDVGSNADNFMFAIEGDLDNISSIDGIDFQETVFPFLTKTFFHFERGGNDTGTWQAILADGSLGAKVAFSGATAYADTGINVNGQNAYGVVFTTDVPVKGVRITASGHDTLSISALTVIPDIATRPNPADGSLLEQTWVTFGWSPGQNAVSHNVYMGDNFDDVNDDDGTGATFRGNETSTTFIAGFAGYPYPDGLVPGMTYYWRIDEVNDADPNSPWKGDIWSFSIPSKTAYYPDPADGAELVGLNVQLNWTAGFDTKVHYIVFGEDFDEVSNTVVGVPNGTTNYRPGPLNLAKTYYWRVDEFDGIETHKGDVWSFTTLGAVSGPNPANDAVDIKPTVVLTWDAGAVAASHEVYFGTDSDAVENATTASSEYKGPKALGEESYDPGKLTLSTTYFWRIDEVNGVNSDSPWAGNVWSFMTGDFFVVDDFEGYDIGNNEIWWAWKDGLGYIAHDNEPAYSGNGTGSAVGDETTASYTEETIVYGGNQSMPFIYDNNKQGYANYSEAEKKLSNTRDWTEDGVTELSLWFRGNPASVGSFVEAPVGTYTMTASGSDIWNQADEFHFAYKILTGPGTIIARVDSVEQTDPWAKAGVMIRETLDAGSKFAAVYITPTNADGSATNGCRFQARTDTDAAATSDSGVATPEQTAIVAPYWVKLERDVGGNFRGYYSSNGSTWQSMSWNPQSISMSSNVYVGLALTSHNASATCQAKFSSVTITGTVGPQWVNHDVGIASNAAEPLYVAVSNNAGTPAVVIHDDPAAATINTWTQWIIPLQAFADQGIVLTNVDRIAIGLGTKGNMTAPGGSGKMYFDNIRLYRPMPEQEQQL
ncbi:hypothetical protein ACFL5F_04705 [Planctomycetota bacterium]